MDRDRLEKTVDDPNMISGIHNYCDRWCERCTLSSRCAIYVVDDGDDPAARDIENQAFWGRLGETLVQAFEMVAERAQELGIDFDPAGEEEYIEREEARRRATERHPLCRAARRYWQWTDEWMDAHGQLFEDKAKQLESQALMAGDDTKAEIEAAELHEAVEVIRWYQHFILSKVRRALHHDPALDAILEGMPRDCDGSAKIALIAMDRSIAAWGVLREALHDSDDTIIGILAHLDRLRRVTEAEFPQARAFVRPGFDEGAEV